MKIKFYRHFYHKDIYLARNWGIAGGGPTTDFYYATKNFQEAISSANRKEDFEHWFHSFLDDDLKTKLTAKIVLSKEIEIDGYKGICTKTMEFPVHEFELVELVEKK
jgi:hypothetical protein